MTERKYTVKGRPFIDMYSYTQAGQVTGKRLRVTQTFNEPSPYPPQTVSADLNAAWTYDYEGKLQTASYPQMPAGVGQGYQGQYVGGQTYNYGYDANGRLKTMDAGGGTGVITDATDGPAGELLTMSGVVSETRTYNERLQLIGFNGVSYSLPDRPEQRADPDADEHRHWRTDYLYWGRWVRISRTYGEARGTGGSMFATYTRDGGSGLDYAINRWYSSGTGRFMSRAAPRQTPRITQVLMIWKTVVWAAHWCDLDCS